MLGHRRGLLCCILTGIHPINTHHNGKYAALPIVLPNGQFLVEYIDMSFKLAKPPYSIIVQFTVSKDSSGTVSDATPKLACCPMSRYNVSRLFDDHSIIPCYIVLKREIEYACVLYRESL